MRRWLFVVLALFPLGCEPAPYVERPPAPENEGIYGFANRCYTVDATPPGSTNTRWLAADPSGATYSFSALEEGLGARFTLRPADLGTYLFYDADEHYLLAQDGVLVRDDELLSDYLLLDDTFRSPAEWDVEVSPVDPERFRVRHHATGAWLTTGGLSEREADAAVVAFYPAEGCAPFPELTVDADGAVEPRSWPDGDVFGIVETHAHLFTNFGFGGGGMFHGSPFHRLGVEHALPSCEPFHGAEGRADLIGYAFSGLGELDTDALITALTTGMTPEPNHATDGYPTFSDWPNAWRHATHQAQYYRWLERAWMAGLRLFVQHATTNSVLCEAMVGLRVQDTRYACDDMVAVEREIEEAYALERYVDAQAGGPGRGFLHIVTSPAEARETIAEGRLAIVLGIETSHLFDCLLTPTEEHPRCTEESVRADLDRIHDLGVRALFPVHKLDNAFGAGDGDRNVGQIGSFIATGHWSNFVLDCPDVPTVFDRGNVTFGGLNMPRDVYDSPAPHDFSRFERNPLAALAPFLDELEAGPLVGDYCQNAGLTPLGETLIREMMLRGMILEVDHLPRRSFVRAYEMAMEAGYPVVGSHGNTNRGVIYDLGGVSKTGLGRCGEPGRPGAMGDRLRDRIAEITAHGGYPAEGFGFDFNGFAGAPGPRFGPDTECGDTPQANPMSYPFTSYAGDVTFTEPYLGERRVDFDTEGMIHLGLLPELIEDARNDGVTDADLEPLFRSAEGYLRMWERAEERAEALRAGGP